MGRPVGLRISAGDRSELPAVGGLINGEEDDVEARMGTESLQHRPQRLGELGLCGDVVALVLPVGLRDRRVVVPEDARMDLHDQAVLAGHLGHLVEHVGGERGDLGLGRVRSVQDTGVQVTGCSHVHGGGVGQEVAVIGGTCASLDKGRAALP